MKFLRRSRPVHALLVWLALTGISSAAHVLAWNRSIGAEPAGRGEWLLKRLNNVCDTVAIPASVGLSEVLGLRGGIGFAIAVNALAWGAWIGLVLVVLRLRRWMHARAGPRIAPEPDEMADLGAAGSRRRFLVDATFLSGSLGFCGLGCSASVVTPWSLVLRRYSVEMALSLKPDLIVLTGDYVHDGTTYIDRAAALFEPLVRGASNCIGVVGVLGNHDHYADAAAVTEAMQSRGIRMVDNTRLFIDGATRRLSAHAPDGPALCIAGVDDLIEGNPRPDLALEGVNPGTPRILLSHNPDLAEIPAIAGKTAPAERVDLMLCGHTHGGQVKFPVIGAPVTLSGYGQKYLHGLVQGPGCRVLVSAGIGMSFFPVRFGVPPEVVEITLTRE
jgi:predicted MPP superfamily phosphohydrolase